MTHEYMRIYRGLRARLEAGDFTVGEKLPSIIELQAQFDASAKSVRRAEHMLIEDGYLSGAHGIGFFVVSVDPEGSRRGTAKSEGATGPIVRVALGLRFELYDDDGQYVGSLVREDVKGTSVPQSGDLLGRGTLSAVMHDLVGLAPVVDHIEHYLDVPDSKDGDPLAMVVVAVRGADHAALRTATEALTAEGWSIHLPSVGAP